MTTAFIIVFYMQVKFGTNFLYLMNGLYDVIQLFRINEYIIYSGMIGWFFSHGLKPVIYLSLNSTIQLDVARMICVVNCTKKKQQENHI
jgi:hypothetical protein